MPWFAKHDQVELQIVADFPDSRVLEQRLQPLEHGRAASICAGRRRLRRADRLSSSLLSWPTGT